jgi:hypothetical protein
MPDPCRCAATSNPAFGGDTERPSGEPLCRRNATLRAGNAVVKSGMTKLGEVKQRV